jgi:hypothetical protein
MKIVKESIDHWKVEDPESDFDLLEILKFLRRGNLPEKMAFSFHGTIHSFLNEDERYQFTLGLESAWNFLDDIWYQNYERGL